MIKVRHIEAYQSDSTGFPHEDILNKKITAALADSNINLDSVLNVNIVPAKGANVGVFFYEIFIVYRDEDKGE